MIYTSFFTYLNFTSGVTFYIVKGGAEAVMEIRAYRYHFASFAVYDFLSHQIAVNKDSLNWFVFNYNMLPL